MFSYKNFGLSGWDYKGFGWFRAGWPQSTITLRERFEDGYVWIGPYIIGYISRF